jgi:hypothetical protein
MEQWIRRGQCALWQKEEAHMTPAITAIKPEAHSKGLDRARCCWHVGYEFCGLNAEIAVYANDEAGARSRAVEELRNRGLRIAA